jgi:hypothetical protein
MNSYPSWIHRIPEMLEVLALLPDERIDRRRAAPGCLSICCQSMEHLVEQLVLVAQALDSNYEGIRLRVESGEAFESVGPSGFLAGALGLAAGEDRPAGISSHDNSLSSQNGKNEAVSLTYSMSYR